MISTKTVQTIVFRLNASMPKHPLRSWFHSRHFCFLSSVFSSDRPRFVIPRSSSLVHSGPNLGTVTSSTASVSSRSLTELAGVGKFRYLMV